jgi:hypothetical protein
MAFQDLLTLSLGNIFIIFNNVLLVSDMVFYLDKELFLRCNFRLNWFGLE